MTTQGRWRCGKSAPLYFYFSFFSRVSLFSEVFLSNKVVCSPLSLKKTPQKGVDQPSRLAKQAAVPVRRHRIMCPCARSHSDGSLITLQSLSCNAMLLTGLFVVAFGIQSFLIDCELSPRQLAFPEVCLKISDA